MSRTAIPNPDGHDTRHALGLDLAGDTASLAVAQRRTPYRIEKRRKRPMGPSIEINKETGRPHYAAVWVERFALGTGYPEMAERVARVQGYPSDRHPPRVIMHTSDVGDSVVRLFREAGLPVTTIETGSVEDAQHSVSEEDLTDTVQTLLQSERLKIAEDLPHAKTLVQEPALACALWHFEEMSALPDAPASEQKTDWGRQLRGM